MVLSSSSIFWFLYGLGFDLFYSLHLLLLKISEFLFVFSFVFLNFFLIFQPLHPFKLLLFMFFSIFLFLLLQEFFSLFPPFFLQFFLLPFLYLFLLLFVLFSLGNCLVSGFNKLSQFGKADWSFFNTLLSFFGSFFFIDKLGASMHIGWCFHSSKDTLGWSSVFSR